MEPCGLTVVEGREALLQASRAFFAWPAVCQELGRSIRGRAVAGRLEGRATAIVQGQLESYGRSPRARSWGICSLAAKTRHKGGSKASS